jgi:hypothetical protein
MTLIFTFPGMRGGLFHSGGALLPFFFAAAGPGLEVALRWAARRFKGWHARRAWPVFSTGLVGIALLLTILSFWQAGVLNGQWNERDRGYADIGEWLAEEGASQAMVMVGNAPSYTWHTGQPSIAIPNEPLGMILAVAERYGARYLILDHTRPRTTDELYTGKKHAPQLILHRTAGGKDSNQQIYEITGQDQP